ncbi:MAG TPA: ribosomal protein S18-alanine N-acetyltransferase [Acidimicrobiia bacterium]
MSRGDVVVSPMRKRNLRAVLAIEEQVNPKPWTLPLFQSELALRETRAYYVAHTSLRQVIGFGGLMLSLDDGHITTLGVDPAYQRRHVATRLMLVLAQTAIERGASALTLEVRLSNRPAQELYRRFGFAPVGVRKAYYQQPDEDALIMWAHDVNGEEYGQLLASHEAVLPSGLRRTVTSQGRRC